MTRHYFSRASDGDFWRSNFQSIWRNHSARICVDTNSETRVDESAMLVTYANRASAKKRSARAIRTSQKTRQTVKTARAKQTKKVKIRPHGFRRV